MSYWKIFFVLAALFSSLPSLWAAKVDLVQTPNGGLQPQAAIDARGATHLIYFQGKPAGGDIFYVTKAATQDDFSKPIRVNSRPGSAIAVGSIRGAQLALGRDGRAHVAWMGSDQAAPAMVSGWKATPMLYSRLDASGQAFEPERNVLTWAAGLDGGGSVAADPNGNVYVAWHASPPDNKRGEAGRAVFVAISRDDGKTFAAEKKVSPANTGACGCCGMKAFADERGNVYLLYRAARDQAGRDMTLLASQDRGASFILATLDPWRATVCPMSSCWLTSGRDVTLAAWETQGQVRFSRVASGAGSKETVSPAGEGKRKHPVVLENARGETLFAWTENTGWEKGGSLAWQLFDEAGKPAGEIHQGEAVPKWGLVSAIANPDGHFTIFY